jgi:hypothetical protein
LVPEYAPYSHICWIYMPFQAQETAKHLSHAIGFHKATALSWVKRMGLMAASSLVRLSFWMNPAPLPVVLVPSLPFQDYWHQHGCKVKERFYFSIFFIVLKTLSLGKPEQPLFCSVLFCFFHFWVNTYRCRWYGWWLYKSCHLHAGTLNQFASWW